MALIEPDGWAFLPLLSETEVTELAVALGEAPLARSRAGARHLLGCPAVAALARDPRLRAIASAVLGKEARPFGATLFAKSARSNWLVVWHQDKALPLRERRLVPGWGPWSVKAGVVYAHAPAAALSQVVALRVHLDDSTSDNGPLRVLPGSHELGVLSDAELHELAQRVAPVECVAPRGSVVTMRPLLVHASSKVATDAPRRVIHIEYAASVEMAGGLALRVA